MAKLIKAFITRDDFVNNSPNIVSSIYEISDKALTYSKNKQQFYSTLDSRYSLYLFNIQNGTTLLQNEVNNIIKVVSSFATFLTNTTITSKQNIIISFTNDFNTQNPTNPVTNLNYNQDITHNSIKAPDYLNFTIDNVECSIWLSNEHFLLFYPNYEINIVLPFQDFTTIINNTPSFITALDAFNLLEFNSRIESNKENHPTTYTKILNIPYRVPNTTVYKNCYFAFNIYGTQGNYDFILKLELYNYLTTTLGFNGNLIEQLFPSILNINEFFITPRWERMAIPSQIGQIGINSQISLTYTEGFDINKFIKIFTDQNYLRNNTYNVPFDYNNILLHITNGYYTETQYKDFKTYYPDFITITSTHPDFSRMSLKTQRFITLLETLLNVSNCDNAVELFNKIIQNTNYNLSIINRAGVEYLTVFYDRHQYYVLPKYELLRLL